MAAHNLPQYGTRFFGRSTEISEIVDLLTDTNCRLLTLVGPGGIGKTRLAIEIATYLHATFADGAYFIPLTALTTNDEILTDVAQTISFQPSEESDPEPQLLDYLSTKQMLLIMDNFEHLLGGVSLISNIMASASRVKVLATSREPLNLQQERIWHVRGMAVPNADSLHIEDYGAIRLFVDRAQRVQRDFSLADEREPVVRICQLVEGLPLALELAAAWLKSVPCQTIANQIERNIDFLATAARDVPERHRSMRAVFDHSWQLLPEHERTIFSRLSVFRGSFTVEAAEHVTGASLATLAALADKSLIQPGRGQRYELHELLRQYGDGQLADDRESLHTLHATYFAKFLSQREADLKGRRQKTALDEVAADHDNIRIAWEWAVQARRYDLVNQMFTGAQLYFYMYSRLREYHRLHRMALIQFQSQLAQDDPMLWPILLASTMGTVSADNPDPDQAWYNRAQHTLQMIERQGKQNPLAFGLKTLGHAYEGTVDFDNAIRYYEQSLDQYQQLGDEFHMGWLLQRLGICYMAIGQWDQGYQYSQRSLTLSRRIGNHFHAARALYNLGLHALYHRSDFERARHYLDEASSEQHEIGNPMTVALITTEQAFMAYLQGDVDTATRLASEVVAIADQISRPEAQSAALALQALSAALSGNDSQAKTLAIQSLGYKRIYPITIFWTQMALNMAAREQRKPDETRQLIADMLQQASQIRSPLLYACCLPFWALMLNDGGRPKRAVELLGLAVRRLSAASGWIERWQPLRQLRRELIDELGVDTFASIWDQGTQLNLDMTIAQFYHQANNTQKLWPARIEPLSERERKILQLIAEGRSNREIAEQLFIAVSTVKSHNNHIFSKLGVKNRTEAVIHARKFDLL